MFSRGTSLHPVLLDIGLSGAARRGMMGAVSTRLKEGKVPWDLISSQLSGHLPEEVVLGPGLGEDAALVTLGNELWAVASDPITFTASDAGRLSVLINANDVAVRGARPTFFLAVLLVAPGEATSTRVLALLDQIKTTCHQHGIALIGGHTEVTPGLSHSMVVGTMLGPVIHRPIRTGGLGPGDLIGMTKWAGLEGTAILLEDLGPRLAEIHGESVLEQPEEIEKDWISVVPEATAAAENRFVTALHDVTEGGVAEALNEMARASGLALDIDLHRVPLLPITQKICPDLGIDPLGLIGSGALLVGCARPGKEALEAIFEERGIRFTWIGRALEKGSQTVRAVPSFTQDEILKAYLLEGIDGILFDMDGTLIDSEYDWPGIRQKLGITERSIIDQIYNLASPEKDQKLKLLGQIEKRASDSASLKPGAVELLELIGRRGKATALVTNNSLENTQMLLERLSLQFDAVLTRDSGLWKPSGAPLVEAARKMGLSPDRCLAVGDSSFDFTAAQEAGCKRIFSVFDTKGRYSRLIDLGFADLLTLLRYLQLIL